MQMQMQILVRRMIMTTVWRIFLLQPPTGRTTVGFPACEEKFESLLELDYRAIWFWFEFSILFTNRRSQVTKRIGTTLQSPVRGKRGEQPDNRRGLR
jgi:hypothetical protein